jgi:hypothetical protein
MVVLCMACSDDPVESEIVRKVIGPDGGVITSADGVLTIGIRPDTFDEPTEISIQASVEPPPTWSPAYRVRPNVELPISATLTLRHALPPAPSKVAIGAVLREDFEAGAGRWVTLPVTSLDETNELVRTTDTRLSMFYGLVIVADEPDETGTTSADGDTTDGDTTDGDTTGGDTTGGDASDDDTTTATSTSSSSTTTTDTGDDTDGSDETGVVVYPPQCENLFMGPFTVLHATGMPLFPGGGSEDLAMTGTGSFVGASGSDLLEVASDTSTSTWATDIPTPILGARFTAQGELLIATHTQGSIQLITAGGSAQLFADGFGMPNGLYPDADGNVWVTDFSANEVVRIDSARNRTTIASGAAATQPNGIVYDDVRGMLFWSTYTASELWRAPIDGVGTPGTPVMVVDLAGTSDGITLDVCGNIYVVDHNEGGSSRVDRVFLDEDGDLDGAVQEIAGMSQLVSNCANAQFGYGFGAYEQSLFVVGPPGDVYAIDLQIDGHLIAPLP